MAAVAVSSWCQAHPSDSRTEEGGQSHFLSFGVTGGCILDRQARLAGEVGTLPQYTCLCQESHSWQMWGELVGEAGYMQSEGSQRQGNNQVLPKIWQRVC